MSVLVNVSIFEINVLLNKLSFLLYLSNLEMKRTQIRPLRYSELCLANFMLAAGREYNLH